MALHFASARSRILARSAALLLVSSITAACSTTSMTTGATGTTPAANTGQPMPPALVGNNPIANGQQNLAALPPTPGGTGAQPAVTSSPLPPAIAAQTPYPAPPATYGQQPAPTTTAAPPTQVAAAPTGQGQTITVTSGQTLYSLSRDYGVSVSAIAAANGLTQTSLLNIGQRIVIPAQGQLGTPPAPLGTITTQGTQVAATQPAPAAAPAPAATGPLPTQHVVRAGETMYAIAQMYGISPNALAQANNMASPDVVQVGQTLAIPGATRAPAGAPAGTQVAALGPTAAPAAAPLPAAIAATPTPAAPTPAAPTAVAVATPAAAPAPSVNGTSFRWPARGRILSDFGPKPGGGRNDGINIALPEGTQILAAEAGTVIYAGNEIPGYGNLVLIRHADNWVTAYAHTSQFLVSADQTVTRGQAIALVGQSGSVTAPQLHFELRRGSTPVNPLDYLAD
ncbi:MAG: peptidoglycan DD-metalloendopeptidase family protein [Bauldia sp.]